MNKLIFSLSLSITFLFCANTWASFESESSVWPGPPGLEDVYENEEGPTYASGAEYDRDAEAYADWWGIGGKIETTYDSSYQGWVYIFCDIIKKDFEVISAGPASINFSWEGYLQATGSETYDEYSYSLYAYASVEDSISTETDWYYELDSIGKVDISENAIFNYVFDENEVGDTFSITMWLNSMITPYVSQNNPPYGNIDFIDGDSLNLISDSYNGFKITGISGGIKAVDGPALVPIPAAAWLLGSGVIGIIGLRKRSKKHN